jgi:hypothetical protein
MPRADASKVQENEPRYGHRAAMSPPACSGWNERLWASLCPAGRGTDGAARHPYLKIRCVCYVRILRILRIWRSDSRSSHLKRPCDRPRRSLRFGNTILHSPGMTYGGNDKHSTRCSGSKMCQAGDFNLANARQRLFLSRFEIKNPRPRLFRRISMSGTFADALPKRF